MNGQALQVIAIDLFTMPDFAADPAAWIVDHKPQLDAFGEFAANRTGAIVLATERAWSWTWVDEIPDEDAELIGPAAARAAEIGRPAVVWRCAAVHYRGHDGAACPVAPPRPLVAQVLPF